MGKVEIKTVDQYIAAQPEPARSVLRRVRAAIRHALPGAEELISYKIPMYRLRGVPVLYFAGWTQHYSLYPISADVVAVIQEARVPHEVSHALAVAFLVPYLVGRFRGTPAAA